MFLCNYIHLHILSVYICIYNIKINDKIQGEIVVIIRNSRGVFLKYSLVWLEIIIKKEEA